MLTLKENGDEGLVELTKYFTFTAREQVVDGIDECMSSKCLKLLNASESLSDLKPFMGS